MGEEGIPGGDKSRTRRRLTVSEAADYLGITVDAVRGRIKRGTIDHERDGERVYVILAAGSSGTGHDQAGDPSDTKREQTGQDLGNDQEPGQSELVEVLREQLEAEREANREMRRLLAGLIERIPQLEAPRDEPQAPETPAEPQSGTDTPADAGEAQEGVQTRRSWWRRWFGL